MNKKILVVEDEKAISDILEFNLKKEGYEVVCAADGEAGLSAARGENPDLILLDVMLPKLDGFEVCKEVRKSSNVPKWGKIFKKTILNFISEAMCVNFSLCFI